MNTNPKGLGLFSSIIIFAVAALVLFLETHFLIPYLSEVTGQEPGRYCIDRHYVKLAELC